MSVFELSSLAKLRRVGLVRVNNLTGEAIYLLAERHSTLERVHLLYCRPDLGHGHPFLVAEAAQTHSPQLDWRAFFSSEGLSTVPRGATQGKS